MTKIHVITEDNDLWGAIVVTAYIGENKAREVIADSNEPETTEDRAAMKLLTQCTTLKVFDAICKEYMIPVYTF